MWVGVGEVSGSGWTVRENPNFPRRAMHSSEKNYGRRIMRVSMRVLKMDKILSRGAIFFATLFYSPSLVVLGKSGFGFPVCCHVGICIGRMIARCVQWIVVVTVRMVVVSGGWW